MTFSEIGAASNRPTEKSLPELQNELADINLERCDLCVALEDQWPDIPPEAIHYLAETCPKPEFMSAVLMELQAVIKTDPSALSDPDLVAPTVDYCISIASTLTMQDEKSDKTKERHSLDNSASVITEISERTANLKGRAKLAAAREYLNTTNIPEPTRKELTARFDNIETTLASMSAVFTDPTSQSEFDRIVSEASFDFGAPNLAETFVPILEQVEASDTFTVEQKYKLREIVTGSDAQNSLTETMTDEHGNTVPRFTADSKREFRSGVSGYVEGHGRQIIEARAGDRMITRDVTGWSGEDVGFLIEATHMWNMYDSFGVTGFIEDVYKIDFSILGDGNAFDPIQIMHLRQVLSHLTENFEGYDGEIANLSEHKTLIQNQARLMSETQTAMGFENNKSGTTKTLRRLGLEDEKGNSNLEVIKSFGNYIREQYGAGAPDQLKLVEYLHRLHPDLVKPLSDAEKATGHLGNIDEV